jgi:EmrB/QacA subfamily drug resistance transporter
MSAASNAAPDAAPELPPSPEAPRARSWVPFVVAATFFMENLDATIITAVLPQMAGSFGVAPARLSVGISAYLLALAVFIPISGWMADRYGPRRVFCSAIVIFTAASLLCGLCTTLTQFTLARLLQGLGGAMMVPVGRLVVLRQTEKKDLMGAIAILTWPGLAAPIVGPPVGALITEYLSWHWIFFINIPLGIIALGVALKLIHGPGTGRRPLDWPGFIASSLGFSCLMFGLELASQSPLEVPLMAGMLVVGIAALLWSVRHMLGAAHPLIDLSVLRIPTFALTARGGSLFRIAISTAPFLAPLLLQLGFGFSSVTTGWMLLALFAGNLAMKPGTSRAMKTFGFRGVLLGNGALVLIGFAALAIISRETPLAIIAFILFIGGLTRSMQFTALNTIGFADVPPNQMSGASTLFSVMQQMSTGIGIAFGAMALRLGAAVNGHEGNPTSADFRIAFIAVCCLCVLALIDCSRLSKDAGAAVISR